MLVVAAERWLGVPYHHAARLHGGPGTGIDCVNLLCCVYEEAGLVKHIELPYYPPDWMLHKSEEKFLMGILEHNLREVQRPLPGDIALFRFGRCFSHGAIVTRWPEIIHAFSGLGVVRGHAAMHPLIDATGTPRLAKYYSMLQ